MNCICNLCDLTVEDFKISGVAAPYNKLSKDLGGYREVIAPKSFERVLTTNPSVIACIDHSRDSEKILGTTENGTLQLRSTDEGLYFELDIAKTSIGADVAELIKRKDLTKLSFAFSGAVDEWANYGAETIRTITDFEGLHDISIVSIPAYDDTKIA